MPVPDRKLHIPYGFVDDLSHASSVEAVLEVGARWMPELLPCERSSICFLDSATLTSRVHRADGLPDTGIDVSAIQEGTVRCQVLKDGAPKVFDYPEDHPDLHPEFKALHRDGFRCSIVSPMMCNGRVAGTLSCSSTTPGAYSAFETRRLVTYGKLISSKAKLMQAARDSVRQAETDRLTGLANRTRLMRVLQGPGKLNVPDSRGWILGVLHIDLDRFKEVNDMLGHAVGDMMLQHAAGIMTATVGPKDLVARIGGDEFIVVTRSDPRGAHIAALAQQLVTALTEPLLVDDLEVRVGASIGSALADDDSLHAERLISNADMALYEVKRNGRGGVQRFTGQMRDESARRSALMADLATAVDERAFEPYFQPFVSLKSGVCQGFELLARWPHPQRGLMDAQAFLDLAADMGILRQVDEIVRHKGLEALRMLRAEGWSKPWMALNISEPTLADPNLRERLLAELRGRALRPKDVTLEVCEADLRGLGRDRAFDRLEQLAFAGFSVGLDNFGAGLATSMTLSTVPIGTVKIDASLVALLPGERVERILRATVTMAHDLGMSVVAFGIDTPEQYATLRRLGCDAGQGAGISGPLSLPDLRAFLQSNAAAEEQRLRP